MTSTLLAPKSGSTRTHKQTLPVLPAFPMHWCLTKGHPTIQPFANKNGSASHQ